MVPLANYFLGDVWKDEINTVNPLGTGGKLSSAFARLIKSMWGGAESSVAPSEVKRECGQVKFSKERSSFIECSFYSEFNDCLMLLTENAAVSFT